MTARDAMQPDLNFVRVLAHHAARTPDKPAAIFGDVVLTYREMLDRSAAVAGGLRSLGVDRGDVVGLLAYNSADFLVTIFAVNHIGAVAMPINWRLAAAEVQYILEHSQAVALVADDATLPIATEATAAIDSIARIDLANGDAERWTSFDELATHGAVPPVSAEGDDLHRLMYTSGTTGRPKGVMLSHANLAWKNYAHVAEMGFTSADVGLACGPLYHVGALDLITTSMLAVGATTIIHRTFDPQAVAEEIEHSGITAMWTAPAMVRAVLDLSGVDDRDLSSLRLIIAGGEKMPLPYIDRLRRTFPSAWLADAYGLTETVSGDTFLDPDSTISKLGSCGRPCQYLELDIWDPDGKTVPAGEPGEVVLRGPKVFKGYWRDPEATERAFAGGWFHTGDVGIRDADGYLYIVDRLKDMIVSGGENIATSEVERVLYEHDEVVEVAVVGRPHERWGEVPIAFVVLRSPVAPEVLIEHCRGQLAKFKVPTDVIVIDELPRNPSGKVLKRELRDRDPARRV